MRNDDSPDHPDSPTVPVGIRTHLAHAALQTLADDAHVDILHVKGAAVDPSIGRPRMRSTDADIIVRPSHVSRLISAMEAHGWHQVASFTSGSAFGHAANYYHSSWGYVDVHRAFPGLTAPDAFDQLWSGRGHAQIAGVSCTVPSLEAQRLILLLHVARNGSGQRDPDFDRAWGVCSDSTRAAITGLVRSLGAETGFAAAMGDLDSRRDDPAHDLWEVFATGDRSRLAEWRGRFKAARGLRAKGLVLLRAPLVNTDHLAMKLGRRPTPGEVVHEFFARAAHAVREIRRGS